MVIEVVPRAMVPPPVPSRFAIRENQDCGGASLNPARLYRCPGMLAIGPVFYVPTVVLDAGLVNFGKLNYPILRVKIHRPQGLEFLDRPFQG